MNKLSALSKLANAYHYVVKERSNEIETIDTLSSRFHYVRRSLSLQDLLPAPKCTEGFNGKGPSFL
jgi:hypothetical protein